MSKISDFLLWVEEELPATFHIWDRCPKATKDELYTTYLRLKEQENKDSE